MMFPRSPDVAVIGAGPVGCVTALAFARQGAQVLLLEGNPRTAQRLAGEWLHPAGVEVLSDLGLATLAGPRGQGFVVFPEDHGEPIRLDYPAGPGALACEHAGLVTALRETASAHPSIHYLPGAPATGIDRQRLYFLTPRRIEGNVVVKQIVGADGRSSLARRCLGLPRDRSLISAMAGVLLEDVELPYEGYGHVILGGPGPVLAYRIGRRQVRLLLDVPLRVWRGSKEPAALETAYGRVLPKLLLPGFRQAMAQGRITWASNQWRARADYGRPGLALVGDAVGCFHPLTAVGMTLGFLDGLCLARSHSFTDYRRARTAQSCVPELLAISLYKVFTLTDDATTALRTALYQIWREDPAECLRTMRLLSGAETDLGHFRRAFLKVMALAGQHVVSDLLQSGHWRRTLRTLGGFGEWLLWLAASTLTRKRRVAAPG